MLMFTNRFPPVAYFAIGVLTLAMGQLRDAQGCHRGGGGYQGGSSYGTGSPDYSNSQQAPTSSPNVSLNNPATVLAYEGDLNLTSKQVQALERMLNSGKQHAALVLTSVQRKQLAGIVGVLRKSGSTAPRRSPSLGASALAVSP